MANPDRPNGFSPAKSMIGAAWNSLVREYTAGDRTGDTVNDHGDIYIGDPVKLIAGGAFPADSGDVVIGVVVGVGTTGTTTFGPTGYFNPDNLMQQYLPAGTAGIVAVVPAEGVLFEVQTAGILALVTGGVADHDVTAAIDHGSQVTGQSNAQLVASANSDVTVVEQLDSVNNDTALANSRYLVKFNRTANPINANA